MANSEVSRSARIHTDPILVQIPTSVKYTTLPSADVLLDPDMVQEIIDMLNDKMEMLENDREALKSGAPKK